MDEESVAHRHNEGPPAINILHNSVCNTDNIEDSLVRYKEIMSKYLTYMITV